MDYPTEPPADEPSSTEYPHHPTLFDHDPTWHPGTEDSATNSVHPRRRRHQLSKPAWAAVALVVAGASGLLGLGLSGGSTTLATSVVSSSATTTKLGGSPTALVKSTSSVANAHAVATSVDPAIVDINTTLADDEGTAAGTGMVITSSGDVLTNNHVVEDAVSITVTIPGRGTYPATVVGTDVTKDVAVIKINGVANLTTVRFATSNASAGESVVAIGNAEGKGGTPSVVSGRVRALDQTITAETDTDGAETLTGLIETNAPIEAGDSGGPLLNASGEVLGMDTAANATYQTTTSAYSIPDSTLVPIVKKMLAGESGDGISLGKSAYLGVMILDASNSYGPGFNFGGDPFASESGVVVEQVVAGSPASKAGIVTGDVITGFNGKTVTSQSQLRTLITALRPGTTVSITYENTQGTTTTVQLKLAVGPVA